MLLGGLHCPSVVLGDCTRDKRLYLGAVLQVQLTGWESLILGSCDELGSNFDGKLEDPISASRAPGLHFEVCFIESISLTAPGRGLHPTQGPDRVSENSI